MPPLDPPRMPDAMTARYRWRVNVRWICALLLVWFLVTFAVSWHARTLTFAFFGWPFSFWVGAQGASLVYLLIVMVYAWRMNRLDSEFSEDGDNDTAAATPSDEA